MYYLITSEKGVAQILFQEYVVVTFILDI